MYGIYVHVHIVYFYAHARPVAPTHPFPLTQVQDRVPSFLQSLPFPRFAAAFKLVALECVVRQRAQASPL